MWSCKRNWATVRQVLPWAMAALLLAGMASEEGQFSVVRTQRLILESDDGNPCGEVAVAKDGSVSITLGQPGKSMCLRLDGGGVGEDASIGLRISDERGRPRLYLICEGEFGSKLGVLDGTRAGLSVGVSPKTGTELRLGNASGKPGCSIQSSQGRAWMSVTAEGGGSATLKASSPGYCGLEAEGAGADRASVELGVLNQGAMLFLQDPNGKHAGMRPK